jgi:small conductance mechanosensitive channel
MPVADLAGPSGELTAWLTSNALILALVALALLLAYRWARPAIHRVLVGAMAAQARTLGTDSAQAAEVDKRVATLEDLLVKLLRLVVAGALVAVILGLFDLWSVLAGLGIVFAAITLAGQSIVLDYLMGLLILLEGQYFKGDVVRIGAVEGTVEEVGLRRTLVRDPRGVLHSISNGDVRASANLTRTYAVAMVNIDGVADRDLEAAIAVLEAVGRDLAADPELGELFLDAPGYVGTIALTAAGATIRLAGRVRPESRMRVEVEMRRRVSAGLAGAGIELIRPAVGAAPRA